MNAFNKLPGFVRTPPGKERTVLRNLPGIFFLGTLLLGLPSLLSRLFFADEAVTGSNLITTIDIYAIALVALHCTLVVTVAIAAFIIMVMKGPAYVADAYPLEESETPDRPR